MKKLISFEPQAFEQLVLWVKKDIKVIPKIMKIIEDIKRNPFTGLGKPESLKHNHQGYWSRRINDEHRLIYKVEQDKIIIVSCLNHY